VLFCSDTSFSIPYYLAWRRTTHGTSTRDHALVVDDETIARDSTSVLLRASVVPDLASRDVGFGQKRLGTHTLLGERA
jgi:hypothetical protein